MAASGKAPDLRKTFAELRKAMLSVAAGLPRATDAADHLYLDTKHIQPNKKPLFFGAVRVRAKAVSYHLMPVYTHPELLAGISPALKKQMQGKSCFNLDSPDPALIGELRQLTQASFDAFRKAGYV
ncbi:MAG: hypothetical protein ACT4PK_10885 [Gammaproteobacteria bacterium]